MALGVNTPQKVMARVHADQYNKHLTDTPRGPERVTIGHDDES